MTMTKTKVKKAVKQAKKIEVAEEASELHEVAVDEDEEETAAPAAEELDPEILKALNASKRKKKPASTKDIDYIPEFERGDDVDLGGGF
jgi:hypothetical protein